MLDTVVLILSKNSYQITEPEKFTPSAHWVLSDKVNSLSGIQSKQNSLKRELGKGIYKPRLTLANRINAAGRWEQSLKIEVSLPKLFFGNNFDELRYKDFALFERSQSAQGNLRFAPTLLGFLTHM
jgi:hypothetical protein